MLGYDAEPKTILDLCALVGLGLSQFAKYLVNEINISSEFPEVPQVSEVPGVQNVLKVHKVK